MLEIDIESAVVLNSCSLSVAAVGLLFFISIGIDN